jgi:hypothetical protein
MTTIRYPIAEFQGGFVWADDLATEPERPKGVLTCLGCGGRVVFRAGSRRPHFAHHPAEACSGGETVLHATTVRVLADALEQAARADTPWPIETVCESCQARRVSNLARFSNLNVVVDRALDDGIRPDLLVRSGDKNLFVIEVVVTHAPEPAALNLYGAQRLPTALVHPTWDTLPDLRRGLPARLAKQEPGQRGCFEVVSRCPYPRHTHPAPPDPRCEDCGQSALRVNVEISTTDCWKRQCRRSIRVLDVYTCDPHPRLVAAGCPDLIGVQSLARQRGVVLRVASSKMAATEYLMHCCGSCGATSGDNFLYAGYNGTICAPGVTEPVWNMLVCPQGHWRKIREAKWPPGTTIGRPEWAVGLVGRAAALFSPAGTPTPQVRLTPVNDRNMRDAVRRIAGLDQLP